MVSNLSYMLEALTCELKKRAMLIFHLWENETSISGLHEPTQINSARKTE